jgi:hypothetical protein
LYSHYLATMCHPIKLNGGHLLASICFGIHLIVPCYADSGGETSNTCPDTLDSSVIEQSSMHHKLNPSETHPPVLKEDPVLFDDPPESAAPLCIAVIGATGELAKNKVFPALFALYYSGFLPQNVGIFGYSRKTLTDEDLRSMIEANLTCRVDHQYVSLVAPSCNLIFHLSSLLNR